MKKVHCSRSQWERFGLYASQSGEDPVSTLILYIHGLESQAAYLTEMSGFTLMWM